MSELAHATGTCLDLLQQWWNEAAEDERVHVPTAAALATYDAQTQMPDSRIVLAHPPTPDGITFFTDRESRKGRQLASLPKAALTLLWHPAARQVRLRGSVAQTSRAEDEARWQSRPREKQLAAYSSQQSQPIENEAARVEQLARVQQQFEGREVPLPDRWGGYRLTPEEVEFWVGHPARLNSRLRFRWQGEGAPHLDTEQGWIREVLQS